MRFVFFKIAYAAIIYAAVCLQIAVAGDITPYQSRQIEPYKAQTIEPTKSREIEPHKAKTIAPEKSREIQPYHPREIQPSDRASDIQPYHADRVNIHNAEKVTPAEDTRNRAAPPGENRSIGPLHEKQAEPVAGPQASKPAARVQAPVPQKVTHASFLGKWVGRTYAVGWGFTSVGSLQIRADGTYTYNTGSGRYKAEGNRITFTSGPLTAWDNGRAVLTKDNAIDFSWTNPDGAKQWFAFIK